MSSFVRPAMWWLMKPQRRAEPEGMVVKVEP